MEVKVKIDDQLVQSALQLSGLGTQKEVVEEALKAFVQLLQQNSIKSLRGKLNWEGDLNEMRADQWLSWTVLFGSIILMDKANVFSN